MTSKQFALSNLEIIAYADKLLPEQLPAVLPPIFKAKDYDVVVFPPSHIEGAYVYSDAVGDMVDLNRQIADQHATLLPISRTALPNHELWADIDQSIHYEPWDEVEHQHQQKAKEFSAKARNNILPGRLEETRKLCQLAIRYYDRLIDPHIILIAIARIEKKELIEKMYSQAIEGFLGAELCSELVDGLCSEYNRMIETAGTIQQTQHNQPSSPNDADATNTQSTLDDLFATHYQQLKTIARRLLLRENHLNIREEALVAETYTRMHDINAKLIDQQHFFSIASNAMHYILIDYAREQTTKSQNDKITYIDDIPFKSDQLIDALNKFAPRNETKAIIILKSLTDLNFEEIAAILDLPASTVETEWLQTIYTLHKSRYRRDNPTLRS